VLSPVYQSWLIPKVSWLSRSPIVKNFRFAPREGRPQAPLARKGPQHCQNIDFETQATTYTSGFSTMLNSNMISFLPALPYYDALGAAMVGTPTISQ